MPARFPEVSRTRFRPLVTSSVGVTAPSSIPPVGHASTPYPGMKIPPLTPKGAALLAAGLSSDPSSAACLSVLNEACGANRDVPGHCGPTSHGAAGQGWRDQSWVLPARPGTHGCPWRDGASPEEGGH